MYEFLQSSRGDTGDCNGDGDSRGEIEDTPDDGGNAKLGFNGTLDTPLSIWASSASALTITPPSTCLCTEIRMHRNRYRNK